MNSLVSGVVLEGLSTAGKTSVLREIKRVQAQDENAERSVVILGEHYSQQLQVIHGKEVSLSVSSHAELLRERISGVEVLNTWATSLGPQRLASRGLFYLFERFHLNHRYAYPDSPYIDEIEDRLNNLDCSCMLLTVSSDTVEQRLSHRSKGILSGTSLSKASTEWLVLQEQMLECAEKSKVPFTIINTDGMEWNNIANRVMQTFR